jgi:hypothetical protein
METQVVQDRVPLLSYLPLVLADQVDPVEALMQAGLELQTVVPAAGLQTAQAVEVLDQLLQGPQLLVVLVVLVHFGYCFHNKK